MNAQDYNKLMERIEIGGDCKDRILDAAMEQQNKTNSEEMYVENMPVEVITRTPWYRTKAFTAAASLVIVAGMAGGGLMAFGGIGSDPGAEIEVAEEDVGTVTDEDAENEYTYDEEIVITDGEDGSQIFIAEAEMTADGDEDASASECRLVSIVDITPRKVTFYLSDESKVKRLFPYIEKKVDGEWVKMEHKDYHPKDSYMPLDSVQQSCQELTFTYNLLEEGEYRAAIPYVRFCDDIDDVTTDYYDFTIDYTEVFNDMCKIMDEFNETHGTTYAFLTDEQIAREGMTKEEFIKEIMQEYGDMTGKEFTEFLEKTYENDQNDPFAYDAEVTPMPNITYPDTEDTTHIVSIHPDHDLVTPLGD